jgi:hypothetical protein
LVNRIDLEGGISGLFSGYLERGIRGLISGYSSLPGFYRNIEELWFYTEHKRTKPLPLMYSVTLDTEWKTNVSRPLSIRARNRLAHGIELDRCHVQLQA